MKKKILIMCVALAWTSALMAQKIAVVSGSGSTQIYKTFSAAIEGASEGSVIYLPGGGFPIADDVKITKKLTIIGIGHKIHTENPDGYTTVSGNLFFNQGSDGSALMGCYVTGNVYIGNDGNEVDDVLIRCNNINYVAVTNNKCLGTYINQNYLRNGAEFYGASGRFTNNVTPWILNLDDGFISNNIITSCHDGWHSEGGGSAAIRLCDRTSITNNIILNQYIHTGGNCFASGNMTVTEWGDDCINLGSISDWNTVFVSWAGVSPNSKLQFTEEYAQYQGRIGIYSGTGFSDDQLAPVPYIVAKSIPAQTDSSGKLNIRIRVKAGE